MNAMAIFPIACTESSPFIALTGVSMVTPYSCCLFPQKEKSEYISQQRYLCL